MASILCRGIFQIIPNFQQTKVATALYTNTRSIFLQSCLFRAKKSTRERKLKLIKKRKAQKAAAALKNPVPVLSRKKRKSMKSSVTMVDDSTLAVCPDDVWFINTFKRRQYSFTEATNVFRQLHHPTMYNEPNAFLNAFVELDMSTDKKTKFFENFKEVVNVKYPYKHDEDRSILAFCKTREQIDSALEAGATLAGGSEVITAVKRGKIVLPDFSYVVAHPTILPELMVIRGLLKRKFPSAESGTLGADLPLLIETLKIGIQYETKRDDLNPRFGWIDVRIGTLNTEIEHLEDNLRQILANIRTKGPKRTKNTEGYEFMKRCFIRTDLYHDKLLIPVQDYLPEEEFDDSDDEDEEEVAA